MILDPDKLEHLAKFFDGWDGDLAEEARQLASDIRRGLVVNIDISVETEDAPPLQ